MLTYLIRRILLLIPTLLGITLVVFFIMKAAPGDVSEMLLSRDGEMRAGDRAARLAYINERYGLDDPAVVQYGRWLHKVSPVGVFHEGWRGVGFPVGTSDKGVARRFGLKVPDLGHSFIKQRPVTDLLAQALPVTLLLNLLSIPWVYAIAIVSGVYAARHRGGVYDNVSGVVFLALWSVPVIWWGVMSQGVLANEQFVRWFPTTGIHSLNADVMRFLPSWNDAGFQPGYLLDALWHLVLPVLALSYSSFAFMSRLGRGAVLEVLSSDYIRTARAKGLTSRDVLWRHAFRNSLLPLITVAAFIIPGLIGGSIVVEYIFSINGMGKLTIESINFRDQEVVMATTLIGGILSLVAYLVADVLYAVADPRVTYD